MCHRLARRFAACLAAPLLCLGLTALAMAETPRIDGPAGPLEAEILAVSGAKHVLVIVPGSGPIDRDGNSPQASVSSDTYKLVAEGLAKAGIASLRIDKRGFYGSAAAIADPNDVTIAAYAQDARKWVARASELAPCVWIAGHSEGGLVALVAAEQKLENLCGLILVSTSGRPIGRLLLEQMRALPGNAPLMPDIEAIVRDLEAGRRREPSTIPQPLQPLFVTGVQNYMIDLFSYDPVKVAAGWKGPTLIVQGTADMQVKPLDADLLSAALPHARRLDLAGGTHMLRADIPGQPFATYADPSLPLHPDLLPGIIGFLRDHDPQK